MTATVRSGQVPSSGPAPASPPLPIPPKHTSPPPAASGSLLVSVQSLLTLLVVAVFILTFVVQPFRIPSSSMVPTLLVGDFLLVDKQTATHDGLPLAPGTIHRGDVIVFHYPLDPRTHLVKRVIALPGEHVRLHGNTVFVNGRPLPEPYALYHPAAPDSFRDNFPDLSTTDPDVDATWWSQLRHLAHNGELLVPAGHFFVLGDNRNNSEDSRYWGLVPAGNIVGKPLLVYLSLRTNSADSEPSPPPQDRNPFHRLAALARWHRSLHVVR